MTPQFFAHNPLDLLGHDGVEAAMFNRFPLGRTREEVSAEGGDRLLRALAVALCTRAGIAPRFNPLATTRFSLSGAAVPASATQALTLPHG